MSSGTISGIKKDIREQYHLDSPDDTNYESLLTKYKDTVNDRDLNKTKPPTDMFSENSKLLSEEQVPDDYYRICNNCEKPILITTMVDHIKNHCEKNKKNKSSIPTKRHLSHDMPSDSEDEENNNNKDSDDSDDSDDDRSSRPMSGKKRPPPSINDDDDDDDDDTSDSDTDSDDDDDDDRSSSAWGNSTTGTPKTPDFKKLKTSKDHDGVSTPNSKNSKQSKRKERKIKQRNPTEKHLIDFDKQCGVQLPEGGYCARSLTCKSHSMGAKRAVEGRSKPFDELLADYHREHQTKIGAANEKRAKQQELQKLQKQMAKEQREQKKTLQKEKAGTKRTGGGSRQSKAGSKANSDRKTNNNSQSGSKSNDPNSLNGQNIFTSPEEETTHVLNGVSRSFPLPLESTVLSATRFRTKYFRMREMFASSFSVKPGFSSPGYGAIHSRVGCLDIDRTTDYKFRIRTPQMHNPPTNANNNNNTGNAGNLNIRNLTPQQLQNLTPQQLQKLQLQQQKMIQAQKQQLLLQQRKAQQAQHMQQQQRAQSPKAGQQNSLTTSTQDKGLTPQEIQLQQQKLRQQQLQQQKFEAAAFHLSNASKLMQNSGMSPSNSQNVKTSISVNSPGVSTSTDNNNDNNNNINVSTAHPQGNVRSPTGGRVNVKIGSPVNGFAGGRVN
ncbi:SAGA-associated factor 73 [Monosporozyma unispora]|nr:SAGA-associated factor 73 [Kazachstania unispora]